MHRKTTMPLLTSRLCLTVAVVLALLHTSLSAALADVDDDIDDLASLKNLGKDPDDKDDFDFSLSKEDLKALGLKPNSGLGRGALSDSLKNLGLTEKELKELSEVEDDNGDFETRGDRRALDAAPPPGMVAPAGAMRKRVLQDAEQQQQQQQQRQEAPPPPHEPHELKGVEQAGMPEDEVDKRKNEKEKSEERVEREKQAKERKEMESEMAMLKSEVRSLKNSLENAKDEAKSAQAELMQSRGSFQKILETERLEHRNEKEELTEAIEERKRAFEELFEEKQVLGQILREEQQTLHQLQDKIRHPDLGLWIKQRAERAAILMETPETDAMKFYARKYMAPEVTKMRNRLTLLERKVERGVDHLLPAQYGSVVALLLTVGLVGFPVFVTMSTVVTLTKSVSLRQYVLLGNVFLTAFSGGLCIAGVLLRQDPLQTLYEASENMFMMLQLATAIAFPAFIGVIACAVVKARDREDLFVFGCELVFYVLVGLNYRARVWRPAMLGQNIETSRMMYLVYVIDFLSMTALTVSSAKLDKNRLPNFVGDRYTSVAQDSGAGAGQKVTGVTGSASMASARSRLGAIGSNLVDAAIGSDPNMGKEE
eukprot:GFKZ01013675.1.p1 GENE.GFKZ01013675.1~~GFKZ01013675.1.p1  ORF type:complete len:597 (-),score=137.78 GFKZ01013675.1:863-2653(-)